jgi:hypothetical protein
MSGLSKLVAPATDPIILGVTVALSSPGVHGTRSPLEAYVVLLAATPLSGRWMLWVTAPDATVPATEPDLCMATAAVAAHSH